MPTLASAGAAGAAGGALGLGIIPEHSLLDSCTRLSISLEESVFKVRLQSSLYHTTTQKIGEVGAIPRCPF